MRFYLILITFLFVINVKSQIPEIEWETTIGGSYPDKPTSIISSLDGSFYIVGLENSNSDDFEESYGSRDMALVKIDSLGNILWTRSYGGTGQEGTNGASDLGADIIQLSDSNLILATAGTNYIYMWGNHGYTDFWVANTDKYGDTLWTRSYGGSYTDIVYSVIQLHNKNLLLCGRTASDDQDVIGYKDNWDIWTLCIDTIGNIVWSKCYGGYSGSECAYSAIQKNDSTILLLGYTYSADGDISNNYGGKDIWLINIDTLGNIIWEKNYGGSGKETAKSIAQTNDSCFVIVGTTNSSDHDLQNPVGSGLWLFKIDQSGNIIWENSYGHDYYYEVGVDLKVSDDNSIIVGGYTNAMLDDFSSNNGLYDYWILKVDSNSNILWHKLVGGSFDDELSSLCLSNDGGIVIAGNSKSNDDDVSLNYGYDDFWVVKLGYNTNIPNYKTVENKINVYPNPFSYSTIIEFTNIKNEKYNLKVFDITGKIVYEYNNLSKSRFTFNKGDLQSGLYIVEIIGRQKHQCMMIIE